MSAKHVLAHSNLCRQWLEVQKLRQKRSKHKVVDTRASKGRKIRYVTIPKLVNFYPTMPEVVLWSHEKRNELFKSLFL